MEQQPSTKNTVAERFCRIFTRKRAKALAACLALVLLAGGGASYYHHAQEKAAHAQERAALSELNAIQAEKMGVSVLSEAEVRSIAADAIGQEETAVTFDEISLMTGAPGEHFGANDSEDRAEHRKDKREPQETHKEKHDRDGEHRAAPTGEHRGDAWEGQAEHHGAPDDPAMHHGTPPQAPDGAQAPAEGQPPLPPEGAGTPQARGDARSARGARPFGAPGPHFTYLVHCTAGGMHYTLAIDAVRGTVLPQGVRAAR